MPMIDVYLPDGLIQEEQDTTLVRELTLAVLRAEGVANPGPFHLENTTCFVHRLPATSVGTAAAQPMACVRVKIVTPPHALSREGQRQITREATEIIARAANDDDLRQRTWVILTEAAEGGWGIAGTAFGVEEFTALARRAAG
jgi:phenylpyruvate tautomerase PptA (4-oxalocrotonate tautomerase family)